MRRLYVSFSAAQRHQFRDLRRCENVLESYEKRELRALDVVLERHHFVGVLEHFRLIDRRLLQELRHPSGFFLHVPLQVEELRLRFAHFAFDR